MGVLVAAGMMGGLALFLANLARQQFVVQKKSETGAELVALHHKIVAVLYDSDACLATLGEGNTLSAGPLAKLVNKGNKTILATGDEINRALKITEMKIQNITNAGPQTKAAEIKVSIEKLGVANAGATTEKVFKLTVELDSAGKISRCHHTLDSKEHGIKTRMCTEMGGEMVCPNGSPPTVTGGVSTCPGGGSNTTRCSIGNLFERFCSSMGGNWSSSGRCSLSPVTTPIYTSITTVSSALQAELAAIRSDIAALRADITALQAEVAKKVNRAGDAMTGDLSVPNLSAGGKVTAGGPAGTPPAGATACPIGHSGSPPNCVPDCPPGQTGTYPNCIAATCPYPQTGTPPNCVVPSCPSGYTKTACLKNQGTDQTDLECDRQYVGGAWCYKCGDLHDDGQHSWVINC